MKRFCSEVTLAEKADGFVLLLDGRPVHTPGRRQFLAPARALAEAAADEWRAQGERIDTASMPVCGFLNTLIDRVQGREAAVIADILAFGPTDLLCYRAEAPQGLVAAEAAHRDPPLAWIARTHGVRLATTSGITPCHQDKAALAALEKAVARHSALHLVALHDATRLAGSVVLGLALVERALDRDAFWRAATVEETWQREQWGEDAEAARRLQTLARDLDEIVAWLGLCEGLAGHVTGTA